MPSSYTTSLRLTLPATGELAGQWGNTVNTGITELLDAAVAGTTTISTWGGAGVAYTLSNNSGTADEARRMFIVATGTPGEAKNVICPAVSKFYVFRNDTTGGFALTLKTLSGTGVSVPAGQYRFLYCDGTNVVEMFNSAGALTLSGALTVGGTATFAANPTLSAGTANQVQFLNASKVLTGSANMTFNGTDLTVSGAVNAGTVNATTLDLTNLEVTNIKAKDGTASMTLADATGVATFSANPILNAGTANGVLYLNGSKVATSGSALTFDGTSLGIGVNSASSGKLQINQALGTSADSGIRITDNATTSMYLNNTASGVSSLWSSGSLAFGVANGVFSEAMRLTSTGLGIGTSSPQSKFVVSNAGAQSIEFGYSAGLGANFLQSINRVGGADVNMAYYLAGGGSHQFYNNGTLSATLNSSGNLGIGTSSPQRRLGIGGTANAYMNFNPTSNRQFTVGSDANGFIVYDDVAAAYRMVLDSSGNLGIGTSSPSALLHVSNASAKIRIGVDASSQYTDIYRDNATGYTIYNAAQAATFRGHIWQLGGSSAMILDSSGNLGIGTSSPTQRLEASFLDTTSNRTNPVNVAAITATSASAAGAPYTGFGPALVFRSQSYNGTVYNGPRIRMAIGDDSVNTTVGASLAFDVTPTKGASPTQAAIIDPSGNLGLGVTPSAWGGGGKAFDITSTGSFEAIGGNSTSFSYNRYFNGTSNIYKTTGFASIYSQNSSGQHTWFTAPSGTAGNAISFTQAMTLDASGNLLVGGTSVYAATMTSYGSASRSAGLGLRNSAGTAAGGIFTAAAGSGGGSTDVLIEAAGYLGFNTGGTTERARITSGGVLGVGCDPLAIWPTAASASGDNGSTVFKTYTSISSNASILQYLNRNDADGTITQYYRSGTAVGSVSVTSTATAYNTSSDYRLKDNPQPLTGSGAFIDALQPKTWNWKVDGSKGVGFIAHEAQAVSPSSVTGTKDAVDADGKPVMQAMEYGSAEFIANIIAELQSLRARVAAVEGKV